MTSHPQSVIFKLQEQSSTRTKTFSGRYDSLAEIARFVRQAAADAGLNDFATYMVETAVDEACSNIIEHAYGGEGHGEIEITCQNHSDNLTVVIHDWGKTFDPETVSDPDVNVSLDDLPGHGLGLFFMRKWMDTIDFKFTDQGNFLTMVKHKESRS